MVAATSGNYGAAVASQAAKAGLACIVVQEAFDSRGLAQPSERYWRAPAVDIARPST